MTSATSPDCHDLRLPCRALAAVVLAALLGASSDLHAAGRVPDIEGVDWTLAGTLKAGASRVGKVVNRGSVDVAFGPDAGAGLGDGEFVIRDPDGDSLRGTFVLGARGVALSLGGRSLDDWLDRKLGALAARSGSSLRVNSFSVVSVKLSAKPKSAATGLRMALKASIRATANITVGGETRDVKLSAALSGKGTRAVSLSGTSWTVDVTTKGAVKGLGRLGATPGGLDLTFGPHGGLGLAEDEFRAVDGLGNVFSGRYSVGARGRLGVQLESAPFETFLSSLIGIAAAAEGISITNIDVTITRAVVSVKVKPAQLIVLKVSLKFSGSADVFGERVISTGSYVVVGKGCPRGPR